MENQENNEHVEHLKIRVGDVMTRNFVYVSPETSILDCAKKMAKSRVGSLVLKEGDQLKGLITEKDIIWALTKKGGEIDKIQAKDVATSKAHIIHPEATISEALDKMNKKKLRRMPVVTNNRLIGYVTLKDLVKFMPTIFQETREFEKIREEGEKIQRSKSAMSGIFNEAPCEECGNYDLLSKIDGRYLCEACRDSM
ncbi:MAG: CBS domain-containing protein [Candidatus Pacearchaeota archaeon]|jgi:CBS domain-containing protein